MSRKKCTSIGGQAVIEGVMMRGQRSMATAVRDENGKIQVESKYIKPVKEKNFLFRTPFLRGIFNFLSTMIEGMGTLLRSGEVFGGEEEPSKTEKWFAKKLGVSVYSIIMAVAVIFGIGLSITLFFLLPSLITSGIAALAKIDMETMSVGGQIGFNFIEGFVRIAIFVGYIALTSLMKDIRRTFMYHGAEHKTISCYEHDLDMTVENAQKMTTVHDRCGTTFMFLIMVVSILLFSFFDVLAFSVWGWINNAGIKLCIRLMILPLVAGVSYEILKLLAKFDNWFVKILKFPGLLLQKLTTKQPTDDMVECAIVAFETVLAMDADKNIKTQEFDTNKQYSKVVTEIENILKPVNAEKAEIDWIMCEVLDKKRGELEKVTHIKNSQRMKAIEFAKERASGAPLWQVFGNVDFYGYKIDISDKVLSPRPETEYLVEQVIKKCGENTQILDLCAGSGCISVAVALNTNAQITACDISADALEVARKNVEKFALQERIKLVESDMFANVDGKFDIIVSNPPYIPTDDIQALQTEVKDHEPMIALDGGKDGLDFYRILAEQSEKHLTEKGIVAVECGINQAQKIVEMFSQYHCEIVKDLEGIDRIVIATRS
ncbi:MAG: peptide chain release factor N(5)-glutamine methyltransferase [Clostridia bacterium]